MAVSPPGQLRSAQPVRQEMKAAIREVLKGRYLSYHKSGLNGIAPLSGVQSIEAGKSIRGINCSHRIHAPVKERFPEYPKLSLHIEKCEKNIRPIFENLRTALSR
jgi:hypothetical protein